MTRFKFAAATFLGTVTLALAGCGRQPAPRPPEAADVVRVTLDDLFQGDTARLAPHLDFFGSGCAKVDYRGKKKVPVKVELEVWHDGKRVNVPGPFERVLSGPGEITFSLKYLAQCPEKGPCCPEGPCYLVTLAHEGTSCSFYVPKPELKRDKGAGMDLSPPGRGPHELAEGKPVVLWGAHTVGKVARIGPHEELAPKAEWGAVLKLSVRPWHEWEKARAEK